MGDLHKDSGTFNFLCSPVSYKLKQHVADTVV